MNSRSGRAVIDAMAGAQSNRHDRFAAAAAAEAGTQSTAVIESDVLLARSGYIVVAG